MRPGPSPGREKIGIFYFAAAEPVTCSTICVPLSSFTLRLAELITEPCALPAAAVFSATPCIPTTPRVVLFNVPLAAAPTVLFADPLTAPVVEFVTEPAVLLTPFAAEPAVDVTPPTAPPSGPPPGLLRPPPMPLPLPLPEPRLLLSSPASEAAPCAGGATAWITLLKATSCPPLRTALSKAMPSLDSALSLLLACASVTWPTSLEPLCRTTVPFDFTSCVSLT